MYANNIVEANDLFLGYSNKRLVLKKANFHIGSNEIVFIHGTSGSGKSTLLKSLYGDVKVKNGSLSVLGNEMSKMDDRSLRFLRQDIGIVFQNYRLIPHWTIEENIMLPLKILRQPNQVIEAQVDSLLTHVNLNNRRGFYPNELSGGEQQRVALARALAHNPKLILADEPTGNLDEYSADLIWDLLRAASEQINTSIVIVTHKDIPQHFGMKYRRYSINDGSIYEIN
jgi:cell division transport system ATP-binding protein